MNVNLLIKQFKKEHPSLEVEKVCVFDRSSYLVIPHQYKSRNAILLFVIDGNDFSKTYPFIPVHNPQKYDYALKHVIWRGPNVHQ